MRIECLQPGRPDAFQAARAGHLCYLRVGCLIAIVENRGSITLGSERTLLDPAGPGIAQKCSEKAGLSYP